MLLTDEIINYLSENFKYNLSISIDGTQKVHDLNRRTKNGIYTYEKVVNKAKKLLGKCSDVRARMTYTPDTVEYLSESVVNLVHIGFKIIVPVPDYTDKRWEDKHCFILENEIDDLYERFGDTDKVKISVLSPNFNVVKGKCNAGFGEINISCEGELYPCTCMVYNEKFKLGNANSTINMDKLNSILKISLQEKSECDECGLSHWCIGARCNLVNKIITGEYNQAPEFLCAETHAIYNSYVKWRKIKC